MVLGPEEIDRKAQPAGGKHYYTANDFAHKADGLLEDVDDCQDGQYETDEIDNCSHNTNMRKKLEIPKRRGISSPVN